jgi:hypothetical protein
VSNIQYQPTIIKVYATYSEDQDTQILADQFYEIIQDALLTTPTKLTDRDLVMLGDRIGVKVTASSLNGSSSVSVVSVSSALYLKYLEVQLTPNNSDMIRGDDARLLWGSESGELFIFGQGDED